MDAACVVGELVEEGVGLADWIGGRLEQEIERERERESSVM